MSASEEYIKKILEEKAKAEADRDAIIQEFSKTLPEEWTPEDLKDKVRDLLGEAYARIKVTINCDNEALAYKAAKDVFDIGIGRIAISDQNDPNKQFEDFVKSLKPKTEDEKVIDKVIQAERKRNKNGDDTSTDGK
jgi:hypothetical protein